MQAQTLGTGTIDISRLISSMQGKLAAAQKAQLATKRAQAEARAKTRAYWRKVDLLARKRLEKNVAAATAGLTRIIEFAKRPEIQRLIKLEGQLRHRHNLSCHDDGKGEFMLFYLDYVDPSDDKLAEMHDQHAGIFLSVGAIAPAPADAPPPPAAAPPPAQEPKERTPRSPRYDRRDLKATDE